MLHHLKPVSYRRIRPVVVSYRRDELELSFHMAMGTASEALTSLKGVACNMAILAGAAGGLSPKFDVHIAY